ncbi:MAG: response regulator [Bdellovibrionaceae bacterium]|nr:response regulator [Pseudobdellovibrionaceae bacterium]
MRKNILLVDDDEHILKLVTFFLSQAGFAVKIERDGFSALSTLESTYFDLVLLDISMPHLNGFKVLRTVKKDEYLCNIPIIMLTGSSNKDDLLKAKSLGVEDYLIKPPMKDDLLNRIERVLGGRPQLEEYIVNANSKEGIGSVNLPLRVTSISRRGLIVHSEVAFERNQLIKNLEINAFKEINIQKFNLRVTDCIRRGLNDYELFLSFINLNSEDQNKIFKWIMAKTYAAKRPPKRA